MPPHGKEIHLSDFELYVMRWFVSKKILNDEKVVESLEQLVKKLKGTYADND